MILGITEKQLEILKLMAIGDSSEEIAKKLGNSINTIESHRVAMLRRFQVKNAVHLMSYAYQKGFLVIEEFI